MAECDVNNIEQTLFLGCSIETFSCSLGFNEQPTEVNIRLVRDNCSAPKIYYDISSSQIRKEWIGPDPGFASFGVNQNQTPELGAACYFRFGDFEFTGLLQSWTKLNTKSDTDVYDVKLISPVEVLEGCQLIIGDYGGPVRGYNIFNIFGFHEVFSNNSPAPAYTDPSHPIDGPILGSYGNAFGGANTNSVGMPWSKIKDGIHILTSSLTPVSILGYEEYSQFGRITYYGGQVNGNFGLIPRDDVNINLGLTFGTSNELNYYLLDLTQIPFAPDDYRIAGPSISILSLISQVCSDFGFDFYIELLPVRQGGVLRKIIKVRTISRLVQPDLDIVQKFIDATPEVIDSSFGRELRNENTTTFLVGGQKHSLFQMNNGLPDPGDDPEEAWLDDNFGNEPFVRDRIAPFFGTNSYGNAYVLNTLSSPSNHTPIANASYNSSDHYINLELKSKFNWAILGELIGDTIPVSLGEMRAAETSYDSWCFYINMRNTSLNPAIDNAGLTRDTILNNNILNSKMQPRDVANLSTHEIVDQLSYELRNYQQIIADIYTESKKTFMVRVPWLRARYQIDSTTVAYTVADLGVAYTDEPTDGGWSESSTILGLANPSIYIDALRQEDGKIKPFAFFDLIDDQVSGGSQTNRSTSQFDSNETIAIDRQIIGGFEDPGVLLYYPFSENQTPVFLDKTNLQSPRVLISFSQPLDFLTDTKDSKFNQNGWDFTLSAQLLAIQRSIADGSVEPELLYNLINPPTREPDAVVLALKSNSFTYGPWKPNNIIEAGPPGQIRFQKEEDLVPWTYGGLENLNDVGQFRANSYVTAMSQGEVGNIVVFGIPSVPLGAEIGVITGLTDQFYPNSEYLIENRINSFSALTVTDVNGSQTVFNIPYIDFSYWNGSYGPNVTSISIDFSPNGVQTSYTFRTYTPKFGIMSKLASSRIEQRHIAQNQQRARLRFDSESKKIQQNYLREFKRIGGVSSRAVGDVRGKHGTPHSVLVGNLAKWDSNIVTGTNIGDGSLRRGIVSTKSIFELQNHLYHISGSVGVTGFNSTAMMSFDGLIRPISMGGDGGLPRYAINIARSGGNSAAMVAPFITGVGDQQQKFYNLDINSKYLNPFSNPSGYNFSHISERHSGDFGHDIDILARNTLLDFSGYGKSLILPIDSDGFYTTGTRADYSNDYRLLSLRGPLVLQGWGYDTDGKPIPNAADTEIGASGGYFVSQGLHDKFLPNFLRKSHTWPVAPVDLRFDRRRNVWTSPPPYDFVPVTISLTGEFTTSGIAIIDSGYLQNINPTDIYGNYIDIINTPPYIVAHDLLGNTYSSGDKVMTYYDARNERYNILAAGGGSSPSNFMGIVTAPSGISAASGSIYSLSTTSGYMVLGTGTVLPYSQSSLPTGIGGTIFGAMGISDRIFGSGSQEVWYNWMHSSIPKYTIVFGTNIGGKTFITSASCGVVPTGTGIV